MSDFDRMRKYLIPIACLLSALLTSCSPRDVLSRRLAGDLIAGSNAFKAPQQFTLHTGAIANKEYLSPEYLVLQHRGWISATSAPCTPDIAPPPCWDVLLTPSGVETIRPFIPPGDNEKAHINIPAAKRQLVEITGISKQGNLADVSFTWRWVPQNEVGGAIYSSDLHYSSTVAFRDYDDGWRVMQEAFHSGQSLDEAIKNAVPIQ